MSADLNPTKKLMVLLAAFLAMLFDGFELGLMPVASLSVTQELLGDSYTASLGGEWFASYTAGLMLGAALGGIFLGQMGDSFGRSRALGIGILFYSLFAGLGAFATTPMQMLLLRFLVGLGVGGVWPNAVALVAECWPDKSKPIVAGLMGAALNCGILLLSQIAQYWYITPDSWRWIFHLAGAPVILGILIFLFLPESPQWLSFKLNQGLVSDSKSATSIFLLLKPPLLKLTLAGIMLGTVPLVGAWAASKWMIPWADKVGGAIDPGYKAVTQGWWALGAVLGSFFGAQIASFFGRTLSYFLFSIGSTLLTLLLFLGTAPLQHSFLPIVLAQGFVATLFFGWLPLYLPALFPTHVRAAGSGISYNIGRFVTALGVFLAGTLFIFMGGSYPTIGAICGMIYLLGAFTIWFIPIQTIKS
ncbi:MAG: MFS transporter [Planctomycetes bacterium]|nr:MFS transporter [Planctomycetota bacterium]NBY00855.1 MFS transporter [Planctomycetota bacterium]